MYTFYQEGKGEEKMFSYNNQQNNGVSVVLPESIAIIIMVALVFMQK